MRTITNRRIGGAAVAILALAAAAGPVAAASPAQNRWSETYSVDHDCGIVETTTMTMNEKAFFEGDTWVRSVINVTFVGVYEGPSGATYENTTHQNGIFTPDGGASAGQGSFLRGAGGVLVMDAGRLVFAIPSGQTLHASAKVIRFDDPSPSALEAALCARLG